MALGTCPAVPSTSHRYQSKLYHFIIAVMTGFVGIFMPFSKTMDMIFAAGGCLLFSGYIVYDTYIINARLSPDEYIMAAISLYLE